MDSASPVVRSAVAILVALGIAILGLVGGTVLVFGAALGLQFAGVSLTPVSLIVISLVLVQGIAFGGIALGYLGYRGLGRDYIGVRLPSLRDLLFVGGGYVLAFGLAIAGSVVVATTGVEAGANQAAEIGLENPEVLLLLIPASFLLIGPGEELLFRGVVQNRIRESFGAPASIILGAIIFASIHFSALSGAAGARLVSISILFFPSLVFGTVYELTDNLVVPSLIHGAYNATLFSILYFVATNPNLQTALL